jgi:hypothetical protein
MNTQTETVSAPTTIQVPTTVFEQIKQLSVAIAERIAAKQGSSLKISLKCNSPHAWCIVCEHVATGNTLKIHNISQILLPNAKWALQISDQVVAIWLDEKNNKVVNMVDALLGAMFNYLVDKNFKNIQIRESDLDKICMKFKTAITSVPNNQRAIVDGLVLYGDMTYKTEYKEGRCITYIPVRRPVGRGQNKGKFTPNFESYTMSVGRLAGSQGIVGRDIPKMVKTDSSNYRTIVHLSMEHKMPELAVIYMLMFAKTFGDPRCMGDRVAIKTPAPKDMLQGLSSDMLSGKFN